MKFHGMTLPENSTCPEYEHHRDMSRSCPVHRGIRHLRFARAEAAAGNFHGAIGHLTSAFFSLGNSGRMARDSAWKRLCSAAHQIKTEVAQAIAAQIARPTRQKKRRVA